ncbi:hypothetical protein [Amycolatopsis decaplanina]|uniref:Secreted protein n=1 Tax=Amycolatopsis decaplanina DSM 44594 TaxID=1284240 RepID=M2YAL5_9PSEU|nr:hypothetical protein [Amycolatopsis decaplanina]EME58630.1 hypothetical protein H074_18663 [Amycolatopsis decaplanina DSM 44594]
MQTKWQVRGRSAVALTAGVALLSGGSALVAHEASAADRKDVGEIRICKQVRGFEDVKQKFRFIIRQPGEGKIAEWLLRGWECRTESRLAVGSYRVREQDMPRDCEVVNIRVQGPFERINVKNATAVVKVERDRTTTVIFVDLCRKPKL